MNNKRDVIIPTYNELDKVFLLKAVGVARNYQDKDCTRGVGSIIAKDNKIISAGHRRMMILERNPFQDITIHAEHMALAYARENAKGATLYSTLEPCSKRIEDTFGNRPISCSELIYESAIERVVIGITDEDYIGKGGAKFLSERGIPVFYCPIIEKNIFNDLIKNSSIPKEAEESHRNRRKK